MKATTEDLKTRALEEGFDLVGIARSGPSQSYPALVRWLEEGMEGSMSYMRQHAELRIHPERLLPGCRSLLAVAMSYHNSAPPSTETPPGRCRISSYARGRDYHRVMKKKLIRLGAWLSQGRDHLRFRALVDTAPLLEREWARRAGLGWIGKNNMLIHRKFGSELFLGFLLTNLPLEADKETSSHCGTCTACLDACPTQALLSPRLLDARKCIAYLNIEHEGPIDPKLSGKIFPNLVGCDRCNEVCPFNRRAPADLHPEFAPAPHRRLPKIDQLRALDEDGWRKWRMGSSVNRVSFTRFQRTLRALLSRP